MIHIFMLGKAATAGQRFKAIREYAGLTQQELAEASGVNWSTILRFEKDAEKNSIIYKNFMALCQGMAKYVSADPELIAAIIVGGEPLRKIAEKNWESLYKSP